MPPSSLIDFANVQGDILQGLPKKTQVFLFYRFSDAKGERFRRRLGAIVPLIKTAQNVIDDRSAIRVHKEAGNTHLLPVAGVNIAFSQAGLKSMDLAEGFEPTVDEPFEMGQFKDAPSLNDLDTTEWLPAFKDTENLVHLLILVTGESRNSVQGEVNELEKHLGIGTEQPALEEILRLWGDVRPGDQAGHEHFGYLDGISNPSVEGLPPTPNCDPPYPRTFLLFSEGDPGPSWALDGSFLVFRYFIQLVPEFDDFLERNAIQGMASEEGKELLGAKLVGRWKSGAPLDLAPLKDDPTLSLRNDFKYSGKDSYSRCPFGAHVRKTNPRDDTTTPSPIIRRGIPFGPEVTHEERAARKTRNKRGLLFVSYQRSVASGFRTVQKHWANDPNFPHDDAGFDPIIGRCPANAMRKISGVDPNDLNREISFPTEFVLPRGGEYFFSPSLKALRDVLSLESESSEDATRLAMRRI